MHDSNRATSYTSQLEQVSTCHCAHLPRLSRNSEKTPLVGQSPVAHGVKCHVSCDMARYGNAVGHRLFQQEGNILFRLRAEACDLHSLAFVVVSGTAVAPTESCKLSRFEIS